MLKKIFIITIIVLPLSLFADISPGFSIGMNCPWITGDDLDTEFRSIAFGLYLDGQLEVSISRIISFNPALAYSVKGSRWRYKRDDDDESTASDWSRARYLELPLDFKFTFMHHKKIRPYLKAGVSPALFLGATKKVTVAGKTVLEKSYNKGASNFDFGINIGSGIERPFFKGRLMICVIFTFGFINVDSTDEMMVQNRNVSLTLGYLFKKRMQNE